MRTAFINAARVLTAHGFVAANGTDTPIVVPDDFSLQPGRWQWDGTAWQPFTPTASDPHGAAKAALDVIANDPSPVVSPVALKAFLAKLRDLL